MDEWIEGIANVKNALVNPSNANALESYTYFKEIANEFCKQDWRDLKFEHNDLKEAVNYYILDEMFQTYDAIKSTNDYMILATAMELDEDLRQYCIDHDGKNIIFGAVKYKKPFTELQDLISQAVRLYEKRNP